MKRHLRIATVLLIALVVQPSSAKEDGACKRSKEYAPPYSGLIEASPLVIRRVFGRAVIDARGKVIRWTKVDSGCVSLFTADTHQFIASAQIDKRGRFQFPEVPPGKYRLVARAPGFCTGNVGIEVVGSREVLGRDGILLYFRVAEIDSCTDADYDFKQSGVAQSWFVTLRLLCFGS